MPEITKELLLEELRRLERNVDRVEIAMKATHVELQRCLWDAHYGREQIDRSRRAFEAQVTARRHRFLSTDEELAPQ